MNTTKLFAAIAHTREEYSYSIFHQTLLHENPAENYALKHLYSVENCRHLLYEWGWKAEEIKEGTKHITIDVHNTCVYIRIPGTVLKRNKPVKIRGISRYVKKVDFLETLISRAWGKADPYKLELGNNWDEIIAQGNTGEFYQLELTSIGVTCTCYAFSGLVKAFDQDEIAAKLLIENEKCRGQIPDKHCFATWKYLNVETQQQYEYAFTQRKNKYKKEKPRSWDINLFPKY
ncbi:hypothetical protein [Rivularia sp. UHCC 0363]|uniref:hypothetical protein n=1 Tax=Rivularia sp. UHCC 0363 TaxID=3110244 RepID=UPI002B212240|nr:hypothetical protein [Rivularia sp. UHCC 0363]MEA5595686.1 hypothetical protein [Rivularia sp. UHCC 0363]